MAGDVCDAKEHRNRCSADGGNAGISSKLLHVTGTTAALDDLAGGLLSLGLFAKTHTRQT
jgi:hypothetical protein